MYRVYLFAIIVLAACNTAPTQQAESTPPADSAAIDNTEVVNTTATEANSDSIIATPAPAPSGTYTYKLIESEGATYGYEIWKEGKPFIQQTNIPGMPGNKGFATKATAAKVAELIVQKLDAGVMPPSVSEEELQKLNATK